MRRFGTHWILTALVLVCVAGSATAQVGTFANVTQQNVSATPWTFTNLLPGTGQANFTVSTPVSFNPSSAFRSQAQYYAPAFPGSGDISATMTLNISTVTNAINNAGSIDQFMGNATGTLNIISDVSYNGRTILLSATFNGTMTGPLGGNSAGFTSSTPGNTTDFTSEFVNFNTGFNRNFSLSFTSVSPALGIQSGSGGTAGFQFMTSWTASGTGLFSAALAPVPEPTTIALLGLGAVAGAGAWWRRRQNRLEAQVINRR